MKKIVEKLNHRSLKNSVKFDSYGNFRRFVKYAYYFSELIFSRLRGMNLLSINIGVTLGEDFVALNYSKLNSKSIPNVLFLLKKETLNVPFPCLINL